MKKVLALFLIFSLFGGIIMPAVKAQEPKPLNVIIVWHQHQPSYYDPIQGIFTRPWVRLHAANNYWKMAYYLSKYPEVHATIDLSGTLIWQISMYMNGSKDTYQIISEKIANGEKLSVEEKWFMLQAPGGFFDHTIPWNGEPVTDKNGNPIRKIWTRYTQLKNKMMRLKAKYANLPLEEQKIKVTEGFTEQDYIDLAVLFNLAWIDYNYIMEHDDLKKIYEKVDVGGYTREDLKTVLKHQMWLLNNTFKMHEKINYLLGNGNVEVTTVPFAHPIGPILTDFGWYKDFDDQVKRANELYKKYLGEGRVTPKGGWAAESALNDKTLEILANNGWQWVMTDQLVLKRLGIKYSPENYYKPWVAEFNGKKIYLFPRDHILSDRVGFTYSGMNQYKAVEDFINELLKIQKYNYDGSLVYVITLDGENPWEHYPYDGKIFLETLYQKLTELQKKGLIRTVTPSEYIKLYGDKANVLTPKMLERLDLTGNKVEALKKANSLGELYDMVGVKEKMLWPESSWIDGTLSTWIGEPQENYAWYWLYLARKTLMENKDKITESKWEKAYFYLLLAEGSDWFWWYGNDQDSGQDYTFDRYFKAYLYEIYKLAGVDPPSYLFGNYYPDGSPYFTRSLVGLSENKTEKFSSLSPLAREISIYFDSNGMHFVVSGTNVTKLEISIYEKDKRVGNTFTLLQKKPKDLRYSMFPFSKDSVGLMITKHIVIEGDKGEVYKATSYEESEKVGDIKVIRENGTIHVILPFEYIETPEDFYFAISTTKDGELEVITTPIEVKLPVQVKGVPIVDIRDVEGDDHGPGTYKYATDKVFVPHHLDLLRFRMLEQTDSYVMEFYFKELGDNPWNAPNGFSLQIIEVYLDYKPGGNTSAIKMYPDGPGSNVNLDPHHPWDVAFRIAGWDYGNIIVLANGTVYQGEMKISADPTQNKVIVVVPKKFIKINESYGLWGVVLVGSQDGYGPDKWRPVAVEPSQWKLGGADPQAVIDNLAPRVMDMLVPPGFKPTQEEQLKSYDTKEKKLATVLAIPFIKPAIVIKDPEGDDHGPGTYKYATDKVFVPHHLDLLKFVMKEEEKYWRLEFYFKELGDNPWNAPNGFSLQIIEVYFDYRPGGNTSAIKMYPDGPGSNVNLDPHHPWDVALRIAGWDYGNLIVLANGTVYQGEMKISADPTKNAIVVELPKKYLSINETHGLYIAVLVGSQDGYGPDKWRPVAVEPSQWKLGGADPQAVIDNLAPRVVDLLVPPGFKPTQEEQLKSYDIKEKKLATVLMIPVIKGKETEKPPKTETQTPTLTPTKTTPTKTTPTKTKTETKTQQPTKTTTTQTKTQTKITTTPTQTQTSPSPEKGVCGPGIFILIGLATLFKKKR
ncbi:glucodextranase DOMON-like domain-containing protein [Pyrococcus sp. ST04]|uniref:glucodextranase DOMON-like domain-containing protein n=1 Tax=Pyrococcus sp. ST04 TaxID=1183377 RepID=UPI0002605984|nr:glucodextranase DOMON-like domain-containing protein [Pyrococcus sp. ST04]AFK21813.1 amylopullulanase [Pyrococcus sp. ST04]